LGTIHSSNPANKARRSNIGRKHKWDIKEAAKVLDSLKHVGKLTYLDSRGKWTEFPLEGLGLKGTQRPRADLAAATTDGRIRLFIEIDDKGGADHNVLKYLPYAEKTTSQVEIYLLHAIGRLYSNRNLVSYRGLADHLGKKIEKDLDGRFKYHQSPLMNSEKQVLDWIQEQLERVLEK
jgi:hypothetical protein